MTLIHRWSSDLLLLMPSQFPCVWQLLQRSWLWYLPLALLLRIVQSFSYIQTIQTSDCLTTWHNQLGNGIGGEPQCGQCLPSWVVFHLHQQLLHRLQLWKYQRLCAFRSFISWRQGHEESDKPPRLQSCSSSHPAHHLVLPWPWQLGALDPYSESPPEVPSLWLVRLATGMVHVQHIDTC